MPYKCKREGCDGDLLMVLIQGLPDQGKNVISHTIFRYCPKCMKFYGLVAAEMEEIKGFNIPFLEYQGLTQMEEMQRSGESADKVGS